MSAIYYFELLYFSGMLSIEKYQKAVADHINNFATAKEPKSLYKPIEYILGLGGKRLRPVLTLMTTEIFNDNYENSLDAALAIEVFHNFSLIHDDIMDDAPLRRGKETVHEKWNINTGILSGDAMLILAYQLFENYEGHTFKALAKLFSKTAIEVCEGQQYDIDFETRSDVTIPEYLKMIEYKTAVLLGAAMKMGAIVANASIDDQNKIYDFGKNLGIAFQLQDDYLDAFGNPETFGKQVGGDIIENKKTYLFLKALELSAVNSKTELLRLYEDSKLNDDDKVSKVKQIFNESGSSLETKNTIEDYTEKAFSILDSISISSEKKKMLKQFGIALMNRKV